MSTINFTEIIQGIYYGCHPHHRDNNENKSQWIIHEAEEHQCFEHAVSNHWIDGERGFGLFPAANPNYLGVAFSRKNGRLTQRELFLARFEDGDRNQRWHGYPADPQKRPGDRLSEEIKELWIRNKVLPRAKVRKLQRGEPCKL